MVFTIIAVLVITALVVYLLTKKKKTKPQSTATVEQVNISYGMDNLTKTTTAGPIVPIHEVESNLGSETSVVTSDTVTPKKKRAPRKKKEEKV